MSSLIDVQGLLLVLLVSFVGANAMVGAFGLFVVGVSRFEETRSMDKNGTPYAALAALGLLICLALLIVGFLAMIGKLP
ncbi:MAG: hypothetical protein JOZ19_14850 [Rubrobacter sp.]|nr:hypothetical protein [Rubrobacter sp.]